MYDTYLLTYLLTHMHNFTFSYQKPIRGNKGLGTHVVVVAVGFRLASGWWAVVEMTGVVVRAVVEAVARCL